jgi:N-sulfoglucosamine sulfohydrolase
MAKEQRNIIQLVADDLGLMLGCYGVKAIKTPNIDILAAEGTRFTNAFASTASCSGSRSTIYTGLHTHENGQYGLNHGWNHFQTHDHIDTAPLIFNSLGYQTGIIGKVHVGPHSVYPWEWYAPSHSRDVRSNASQAAQFFDKAKETGRPFHLTVGFRDPHRDATREGFGNTDDEVASITVPDYKLEDVEIPDFICDVPELRIELVQYYKAISRMDFGVGLIMNELKKRGLDQDTLIIFVSDNGAPFVNSKTTLYDAGVRLPLIVRCPGAKAGVVNPNIVSFLDILPTCIEWAGYEDSNVKTQNSGKSPRRLGTPLLKILAAEEVLPEGQWKQHVFGSHTFHEIQNYWPTRFMRNHRFKYHRNIAWKLDFPFGTDLYCSLSWEGIRNSAPLPDNESDTPEVMIGRRRLESYVYRGPEELFDLEADHEEVNNLANDPKFEAVLKEMRQKTEEWQYATNDVWLFRDGISAITSEQHQKLGLKLPDRFDFDVKRPGNAVGPHWVPTCARPDTTLTTEQG